MSSRFTGMTRTLYILSATLLMLLPVGVVFAGGAVEAETETVHVYTHRHYDVDQALFDRFTEQTGIVVSVLTAGADELIQRIVAEGDSTPADLLITADAGRLYLAEELGILQPIGLSDDAEAIVAEHLRDEYWTALTKRARVIVYAPDRVSRTALSTYEALSDPMWEGRIAVRSSSNIYNISLLAALIEHLGEDAAEEWAAAVLANMARDPQGNDRDQIRAVAAGTADLAIVNTYYVGLLSDSEDEADQQVVDAIEVFFPNQEGRGAHMNISGAGLVAGADNAGGARQLVEFMLAEAQQTAFAGGNFEYPVHDAADLAPIVESWGNVVEDDVDLSVLGENSGAATRIFDRVGWN